MAQSRGWDLLADGHAAEAMRVFAGEADRNPASGIPKIGYALSAATLGDLSRGVWAMRRACRFDPQAMQELDVPEELEPTVDRLVGVYEREASALASLAEREGDGLSGDADVQFMLASLYGLKGDPAAAQTAITRAIDTGDRLASTVNLKRVIDAEVAEADEAAGQADLLAEAAEDAEETAQPAETDVPVDDEPAERVAQEPPASTGGG